nr:hypothetical protein [Tanacetum cinerariifolium]
PGNLIKPGSDLTDVTVIAMRVIMMKIRVCGDMLPYGKLAVDDYVIFVKTIDYGYVWHGAVVELFRAVSKSILVFSDCLAKGAVGVLIFIGRLAKERYCSQLLLTATAHGYFSQLQFTATATFNIHTLYGWIVVSIWR